MLNFHPFFNKTLLLTFLIFSTVCFAQDGKARIFFNGTQIPEGSTASPTYGTDFGLIINPNSDTRSFVITRDGISGSDRTVEDMVLSISGDSDFSITEGITDDKLTSGETEDFTITFSPTASTGLKTATVTLTYTWIDVSNNSNSNTTYSFDIQGGVFSAGGSVYPDTDGDGIPDNIDLDDDNDGILDAVEVDICEHRTLGKAQVVLLNEDFGSGADRVRINHHFPSATTQYSYEDGTGSGNSSNSPQENLDSGEYTVYHIAKHTDLATWAANDWGALEDYTSGDTNGRMAIFNGNNHTYSSGNELVVYQTTINGLTPDVDINFSFAAVNLDVQNTSSSSSSSSTRHDPVIEMEIFDATTNSSIGSATSIPLNRLNTSGNAFSPSDWTITSSTIDAATHPGITAIKVVLKDLTTEGGGNDFAIDDIRVIQEFCDNDADGTPDTHDLDDDNDGIPNIVELGYGNLDADNDGTLFDSGTNWKDINANGVHDDFETSGANHIANLTDATDDDGDGVPNHIDLDSDNDGVFDVLEHDGLGDLDSTGNGVGDGADSDGDGILDGMDNLNGFGVTSYTPPVETTAGTPDYLNPTSGGTNDIPEIYAHLDTDGDGIINGSTDIDLDGILDVLDTDTGNLGSPRSLNDSYSLYFDGRNDYVEEPEFLNSLSQITLMCWVKPDTDASSAQFILGQDNIDIVYRDNHFRTNINRANEHASSQDIPKNIWTHVAFTYDTTNGNYFYINGQQIGGKGTKTISSVSTDFRIARRPSPYSGSESYFEGEIDEVRVFNRALTQEEVMRMVHQELDKNNSFNRGKIIPIDISSSPVGTNLMRYYKMDAYQDDKLMDTSDNNTTGATIYNVKDIFLQTAPLPFETSSDGNWSNETTWVHGNVWNIWDASSTTRGEASIVQIKHDVILDNTIGQDTISTVGVLVDPGKTLVVNDDMGLYNSWYVNIDTGGLIDLQGESQLLQTEESTLGTGTGDLKRNQQGTANKYTYNYWTSPVNNDRTN